MRLFILVGILATACTTYTALAQTPEAPPPTSPALLVEPDLASCLTAGSVSVAEYFDTLQRRVMSQWTLPECTPAGARVVLAFSISVEGPLMDSSIVSGDTPELFASALEALRSASPLPVPSDCNCLVGGRFRATFSVPNE